MRVLWGSLVGILFFATPVNAERNAWYVGVEGGVEFDGRFNPILADAGDGYAALATVGRRIGEHFSVEAEFGYRSTDYAYDVFFSPAPVIEDTIPIQQWTAMANVAFEVPLSDEFSLHAAAGLGADFVNAPRPASLFFFFVSPENDTKFATQLKVGGSYQIDDTIALTVDYRVMNARANNFGEIDNDTLTVGLRFDL